MICSICKISLYKTEKCNGLSHHNLERCYSCGRIGFITRGLGTHWNINGVSGCFRFDHDNYVKTNIPEYICNDSVCSNHEKGDCTIDDHQPGIKKLELLRKRAYVYHMIKSLLPEIRLSVYDKLYENFYLKPELLQFLPYKQTLILLLLYKNRNVDYIEDVVYKQLECNSPDQLPEYIYKNYWIPSQQYIELHCNCQPTDNPLSRLLENYTQTDNEDDTLSIDSESGLLHTTQQNDTFLQEQLQDITTNILDEIINELNQNVENNQSILSVLSVQSIQSIVNTYDSNSHDVSLRNIYMYDSDNSENTYDIENTSYDIENTSYDIENTTYDIENTSYDIENTSYDIENGIHTITTTNTTTNRYNLPALTLNSYSLLINIESDIESDVESEIESE